MLHNLNPNVEWESVLATLPTDEGKLISKLRPYLWEDKPAGMEIVLSVDKFGWISRTIFPLLEYDPVETKKLVHLLAPPPIFETSHIPSRYHVEVMEKFDNLCRYLDILGVKYDLVHDKSATIDVVWPLYQYDNFPICDNCFHLPFLGLMPISSYSFSLVSILHLFE